MRIRPTAGDQVAVPAQERVRPHGEARPGRPWQRAAQRRQQRPISSGQLWRCSLPPQNRQLVAEDEDLQLLRATRPSEQPNEREQVPHDEIDEGPDHAAPSLDQDQERRTQRARRAGEPRTSFRTLRGTYAILY